MGLEDPGPHVFLDILLSFFFSWFFLLLVLPWALDITSDANNYPYVCIILTLIGSYYNLSLSSRELMNSWRIQLYFHIHVPFDALGQSISTPADHMNSYILGPKQSSYLKFGSSLVKVISFSDFRCAKHWEILRDIHIYIHPLGNIRRVIPTKARAERTDESSSSRLGNNKAQGPGPTLKSPCGVLRVPGRNPKLFLGNDRAQGPGPTLKSPCGKP